MKLQWPIKSPQGQEPPISQPFGGHLADYSRFGLLGHDGVDFPEPLDTPVYAAHDGFIVYANSDKRDMGLGIMQYFEEDGVGYLLEYWHFDSTQFPDIDHRIDKFTFKEIPVKVGDLIGKVDTTGFSTGNHLHFGLYIFKDNQLLNYDNGYHGAVDPLPYLRGETTMAGQIGTQNYKGELRATLKAATPEQWVAICAILGIDPNAPIQEIID